MSIVRFVIKEKNSYSKGIVRMLREIAERHEFIHEESDEKGEEKIVKDIKTALHEVEDIKSGKRKAKTLKQMLDEC